MQASDLLKLNAGATLFRNGDPYREVVYTLIEGDIVMHRASGRQDRVQPGDLLGLANYLDNDDYRSSVRAITDCSLMVTPARALKRLEHELPDLFNVLNRVIANKLRERSPDRSISSGVLAEPVTRIMKSPVAYCGPEMNLRQALTMMKERRIGSLVVEDERENLLGLLTYAGLAEAALLEGAKPDDSILKVACEVPRVIEPDTPLWEAEELMERDIAKYAIVCEDNRPIGIVSKTDILQVLVSRPSTLQNHIHNAHSLSDLAKLYKNMSEVAADARETNNRPSAAVRLLSETHLLMQRRVVELTLDWMNSKGHGNPPTRFAVLILGSGGRHAMTLNPDQDNGIIIGEYPAENEQSVEEWFERFAKRLNRNLDKVGYPLCDGNIMASNPHFRKTLGEWKKQISHITRKPTAKSARWANVMFDFDTLYGDDELTAELRRHVIAEIKRNPGLLKLMAEDDAEGRPALGFFNQLVTTRDEQGEHIDIKRNGLRIIADGARIFALQNGIAVQNSSDRLSALVRLGKLSDDFKDSIQEAHEELLDLVLELQIQQAQSKQKLTKKIQPAHLSQNKRSTLRVAMRAVKRFQDRLLDEFSGDRF
ncbi:MAG: CBS domain-containing protein [Gammaproteobacteria bacterium]|nr:CBS domain-containing protein [Gammaproteobacteria bacterium]